MDGGDENSIQSQSGQQTQDTDRGQNTNTNVIETVSTRQGDIYKRCVLFSMNLVRILTHTT